MKPKPTLADHPITPNLQNIPIGNPEASRIKEIIRKATAERLMSYNFPSYTDLEARVLAERNRTKP